MKRKIIVHNLEIAFDSCGRGDTVVLLHGWGCDGAIWESTVKEMAKKYRVIVPDIPGFGDSEEPESTWGTEDYADFFVEFFRALRIYRPVVIGHSNGGRIAIALGARGIPSKLILVDSAGLQPKLSPQHYIKQTSERVLKKFLNLKVMHHAKEELIVRQKEKTDDSDDVRISPGMQKILNKVVNEDLADLIDQIRIPTLLIWGSEDIAVPIDLGKAMVDMLKKNQVDSALITFNGRSHYAFLEENYRFVKVCQIFMEGETL